MGAVPGGAASELPYLWTPPQVEGGWRIVGAEAPVFHGARGNDYLQQPLLFHDVLTDAQCDAVVRLAEAAGLRAGDATAGEGYRRCLTSFLEETDETRTVFERLRAVALAANERYGFRLTGFGEPLHYVSYAAGDGFGWHTDLGDGAASTRKLSISVQLSAPESYAGGGFELCPHGAVDKFAPRGSALVFPAYVPHRVADVTRGVRRALVAWLHGDAFV